VDQHSPGTFLLVLISYLASMLFGVAGLATGGEVEEKYKTTGDL
jgi:hypothetical protein